MTEPTPTPTPTHTPVPKKGTRGVLNKADAAALNDTEQVVATAQNASYSAPLATRGITAASVMTLATDIDTCRKNAAQAAQMDFTAQQRTQLEGAAKKDLLQSMRYFQSAAKLKFPTDKNAQHEFFIGQDLAGANRPDLETFCRGMISKLVTEPLTGQGVTAAEIAELSIKFAAWQEADTAQSDAQLAAQALRVTVNTQLDSIKASRTQIRLAANLQWPPTDKANGPIRKAFGLPANKPYNA